MKRYILSILMLLLLSQQSKTQVKQQGYYFQRAGDTVFSTITFKKGNLTPTSIIAETNSGIKVLTMNEIDGFGIPGSVHYRKRKVTIHPGSIEYAFAPTEFSNEVVTKEVFVQVIESGTVSLYGLVETERNYFFIDEADGTIVELLYRVKLNQQTLEEDNVYKGQLRTLCTKYNVLNEAEKWLARMSYTERDILRLVQAMNRKSGVTSYTIKKQKVSVGIVAGLNYVIWPSSFDGAFFTPSFNFKASNQAKPLIGINFQYSFPRARGRIQLHASALYSSLDFNETRRDSSSDGQTSTTRTELYKLEQKMILVSVSPVLVLNPTSGIKFFIQPGISVGFAANNSSLQGAAIRRNYIVGNPVPTSNVIQNAIIDDKPFNLHVNLGTGVAFGRNRVELNFLPPANLVNGDFFPPLKKGHLLLTYSFRIIN